MYKYQGVLRTHVFEFYGNSRAFYDAFIGAMSNILLLKFSCYLNTLR